MRSGLGIALAPDGHRIADRVRVDDHWRRHELDGRAPRLTPRETIQVGRPVGRWRRVDPLVPFDGWRRLGKWAGLGLWAGVAGSLGFLGWKTGRGPLGGLGHLDEFGDALPGWSADDADLGGAWWIDDEARTRSTDDGGGEAGARSADDDARAWSD